ncbi:uncharacterized protein LOC143179212 [Calliopsis andreniformis]|uniref:uncharacterized protein LOC143179212 n=1 Tax=Calliopsis andreniformis TaxID=337506 RepID=UPI003FCD6769
MRLLNFNIMGKAIRILMSNSVRIRTWTTLSNYVATHTSLLNAVDTIQSFQDTSLSKQLESPKESIERCIDIDSNNECQDIKTTQDCCKTINEQRTVQMIVSLNKKIKNRIHPIDVKPNDLVDICQTIQRDIRTLDLKHIIMSMNILIFLNIPSDSELMQTIFQFIRFRINDLSVRQIIFVHRLLADLQQSPLIYALLTALPHAFRHRIQFEIDAQDMYTLNYAFTYARDIRDIESVKYILDVLCASLENITTDLAVNIYRGFLLLPDLSDSHVKLLSKTNNVIIANCTDLRTKDICFLLSFMAIKYKQWMLHLFYDENVLRALCNTLVNRDLEFHKYLSAMMKLNTFCYCDINILDSVTEKFIEKKYYSTNCSHFEIFPLVKGLSTGDYRTKFWPILKPKLLHSVLNTDFSLLYLTSIAIRLLALDCYCPELFEKVFTLYYCNYDDINNTNISLNVLRLHQSLQYFYREYDGITLGQDMVHKIVENINVKKSKDDNLCETFKQVFGNAAYIKPNLKSKIGWNVDCTIVLQPDGSFMNINDNNYNVTFIEDLVLPPDYCKLLISIFPYKAYCRNMQTMQSSWKLFLNILKVSTEANIFPINPYVLNNLHENARAKYLEEVIKFKFKEVTNYLN